MEIDSNWHGVVKAINGIFGIDGLNTGEGLGMVYGGEMSGPESWAGAAFWFAGNCRIFVNSVNEYTSLLELRAENNPANDVALRTFEKLQRLLAQPADAEKPEKHSEKDDLSRLIPKDKKTKGKFKKAWDIWKKMSKEYEEDVLDRSSKEAKPKIQDLRTRVIVEMNWEVSERRLQTVIQLGEAKLIK